MEANEVYSSTVGHVLDVTQGVSLRIAGDNDDAINLYEWMNEVLEHLRSIDAKLTTPASTVSELIEAMEQE